MSGEQAKALAEQSALHRQEKERKRAEVLRLHAEGLSNIAIARKVRTASTNVARIIREVQP